MSYQDNKRLVQNTVFLYIRMLLIMTIQFFTVREILKYLGIEDYGIYNVVCGVTNIFTFLTHTMISASQRFLAYDLGKGDNIQLKKTFDTLLALFTICGVLGIIILGIVGHWFICTKLVIPLERLDAAIFAFYFTLLALLISIVVMPFNSLIIAHEDMKAFAYVSVLDAVLKLLIVYCLVIIPFDKLKLYAVLTFFTYLINVILYVVYCHKKYEEVTWKSNVEWSISRKIIPFMSWNLVGGFSWMLCTQGLSIVINMFFGPIANASKAVADKINVSINGFTNNFMMAAQPQIIKTYADDDLKGMHRIICSASKISFFLMLILAVPIVVNADGLLSLWLIEHDRLTTVMLQMVLLFSLIGALENPINQAIRATGKIRNYQVYIGMITLLVIPIAYCFFRMQFPAYYGYVALIIVYGIAFIGRLYFMKKQIFLSYRVYLNAVLWKCLFCLFLDIVLLVGLSISITELGIHPIFMWLLDMIISFCVVFFVGLTKAEKAKVHMWFQKGRIPKFN